MIIQGMLKSFLKAWKGFRQFFALHQDDRDIVFYAEDSASWVHFEAVLNSLISEHRRRICYLTSSLDDPILINSPSHIVPIFIGDGMFRTILFRSMDAGIVVMTMPDLETYYVKRSRFPVHYIYIFHNILSTHMVFRKGAYDHYDTIFCCGPHHKKEIRETERIYSLPVKNLVEHGYGRIDALLEATQNKPSPLLKNQQKPCVLVAPSWGENCILETCGIELIEVLLQAGIQVIIRPHPMTRLHNPKKLDAIINRFSSLPNFSFEENIASQKSLLASHLMISDWSGAAFEFAFCMERPVLFIDVPRKINNPEYEKLGINPFEVQVRSEIGRILPLEKLQEAASWVEEMCADLGAFAEKTQLARGKWLYNISNSGAKGAQAIINIQQNVKSHDSADR
jgi:hypothetical protein